MRLSEAARAWLRRRARAQDVETMRDLARSEDPSVREVMQAMLEAVEGVDRGVEILGPALAALHDEETCEEIVRQLEAEVPALREVLCGYAMLDAPDRVREVVAAWNQGPETLGRHLATTVAAAMLAGMVLERARRDGHAAA